MGDNISCLYRPVQIGPLKIAGNIFLAPVAGYSDRAFRSICVDWGAKHTCTEMVSSEAYVRNSEKTEGLIARADNEKTYSVQIFGSKPDFMAETAKLIVEKYQPECIDINCGCPMAKITKTGAGSALMNNVPLLYDILKAVKKALEPYNVPLSLKIRSGYTAENLNWKEVSQAAIDAGVDMLALHPRTRTQMYSGKADWSLIAELTEFAKPYKIPIFASGDLFSAEDAKKMLETTGCSGVMFARGAMGNPFIFRQSKDLLCKGEKTEISIKEKIDTGLRELELLCEEKGEERACLEMRKRIVSYTKGIEGGADLRRALVTCKTKDEYVKILKSHSLV